MLADLRREQEASVPPECDMRQVPAVEPPSLQPLARGEGDNA